MLFGAKIEALLRVPFWRRSFLHVRAAEGPACASRSVTQPASVTDRELPPEPHPQGTTALPAVLEQLLRHAEPDYQDALRLLLWQMMDLHKLYLEDPGNYLALQHSAVAAVRRFPGMEAEGLAERMIYALEQSVRGNLVDSEVNSEMAKWFCTMVNGRELPHERVVFPAGSTLIRQGERGTQAYLIHAGRARVLTSDAEGRWRERAVLKPVALVGEFRLLYDTPASASVVAVDDVVAFEVDRPEIRQVLQSNTGLRYWIIQEANHRLRPLVEERLGKATLDAWLAGMESHEALAQFKDELLASLFMLLHARDQTQPRAGAAALANVANIYCKIVNSTLVPKVYTLGAGLPELARLEDQSLDLLCLIEAGLEGLSPSTAARIQEVLRFKGACCLLGAAEALAPALRRHTRLTHFALGHGLHVFVKTAPAARPLRTPAPGEDGRLTVGTRQEAPMHKDQVSRNFQFQNPFAGCQRRYGC